ncbi:hypothetical protein KP003_09960 [Geomonas nitrogeniifigens]|uniref:HEAT repeat domain-containing protein n=1 Tax=Geomonas diazotrophica TaxID=2843197 RepID=A0ABX8JSD3_9BACT|nr:hypothetical protein [Geomonas nitrogeniifigens]QWV99519.1 hypothetical protein KP005_09660 [Geomonas nitrogeniifigens]QXE88694.1 hypothetical protein KP003_09960 [Geomonas nitrogeniifigens]
MSSKVTFRISAAAAPYVGADKPRENRLLAASGRVSLPPGDLVLLLYYLCHDPDQEVKQQAMGSLRSLERPLLEQVLADRELHPQILDALVQLHGRKVDIAPLLAAHPSLSEKASAFLAAQGVAPPGTHQAAPQHAAPHAERDLDETDEKPTPDDEEPIDEEEYQSKYQMAQSMGVSDKIKMAMTGDKEWRAILIKDNNKLVSGAAIKNPRMTEAEVLGIAKSQIQNDEIIRVICANKEWIKNGQIRKALVENHKTPLPNALRFLGTLGEKDLANLAKSRNINTILATQARKILLSRKEKA